MGVELGVGPAGRPVERRRQPGEQGRDVADEFDLRGVDLVGVGHGIDVQDRRADGPRLDQLGRVEAHVQHQVRIIQQPPQHVVARHVEDTREQGVVLGEHTLGHRRDHDGHVGGLCQRAHGGEGRLPDGRRPDHHDRAMCSPHELQGVAPPRDSDDLGRGHVDLHRWQDHLAVCGFGRGDVAVGGQVHRSGSFGDGEA